MMMANSPRNDSALSGKVFDRTKSTLFNKHVESNKEKVQKKLDKLRRIQTQLMEGTDLNVTDVASNYEYS
jgi:hypothetical protein